MLASSKVPTSKTVEPSRAPKSWLRNSLERAPTSKMTSVGQGHATGVEPRAGPADEQALQKCRIARQ